MLVGWEFCTFQEWKVASPETFISCSELGPLAAYELPLLSGSGFPQRALLPNVVWGYVCAPKASPLPQLCTLDPNVRVSTGVPNVDFGASGAHKGKGDGSAQKGVMVKKGAPPQNTFL